jgi:hypothetical protein
MHLETISTSGMENLHNHSNFQISKLSIPHQLLNAKKDDKLTNQAAQIYHATG